ncbi:CidA/LrgA family protein [Paenalcaligenes niemegkensis]|uniref:CidA/LrgA family protein n=1 Tax=Paenalcaligenes niemegkensis TaxID=2895469 RepID=UPI001EE88BF7|nr:CidA/LrgA family protein [Paenalcaligenes niemegkensis]MCQ9617506.1 CidA/LrgA family protein [Paenalcaligenes niemegkensis]
MIIAIASLFVFQLLGEIVVQTLDIPLPGPLAGMLLLFLALIVRGGVPAELERTSGNLLQHLMLLFIPAVTGVMMYFERVADEWKAFLITSIVTTAITLVVTALALKWLLRNDDEDEQQ